MAPDAQRHARLEQGPPARNADLFPVRGGGSSRLRGLDRGMDRQRRLRVGHGSAASLDGGAEGFGSQPWQPEPGALPRGTRPDATRYLAEPARRDAVAPAVGPFPASRFTGGYR